MSEPFRPRTRFRDVSSLASTYLPDDLADVLADLEALVEAESYSADLEGCRACGQRLAELLVARLGGDADVGDDGRVAWAGGETPPEGGRGSQVGRRSREAPVLLLGHLDTVWPRGSLSSHPFTIAAGRAYGPGVFDMKAGLVVALHAMRALRKAGRLPSVRLLVTADEEIGSPRSRRQVEQEAARCGRVLVLEPCGPEGAVKRGRKGVALGTVTVTGRAAHAGAEPDKGINAAVGIGPLLPEIAALSDPARGTSVTPTVLQAGAATNTVPDKAVLSLDVRFFEPGETDRVRNALCKLVPANGATLTVELDVNRPPLHAEASEPLLGALHAAAEALGMELPSQVTGGASDGNFAAAAGAAVLDGLGPAGDGAHADHEHVLVADIPRRIALLAELLPRVAACAPPAGRPSLPLG
ncbi:MAG: M20/M25/M40 family metallo-hydrolase [Actinomycetota bacterium]|nr:M20/M25/M40 family metallo-hydrolase [Actinomycetota bacterium]